MRVLVALVILLTGSPALATQAEPSSRPLSLDQYADELLRLSTTIATARPEQVPDIVVGVPEKWWIAVDDAIVEVPFGWFAQSLASARSSGEDWSVRRKALRDRLLLLREEALALVDDDTASSRTEARDRVDEILARPEFQRSTAAVWLDEMQRRAGEWLRQTWERLGGDRATGRGLAQAFAWAAALAALAGLSVWVSRLLVRAGRTTHLDLSGERTPRPAARDLALGAINAMRRGELKEAIRLAYHAALCRLEEEGAWRVDAARTPREYLRLLHGDDRRRPVMSDLTRQFELVWYGDRPASAEDVSRAASHLETLGCLRASERAI